MTSKLVSFASQNKALSAVVVIALAALLQRTVCKKAAFCSSSRVEQKRVQELKSRTSASPLSLLAKDPTSFANIDEVVTKSFHLSLNADFEAKALRGSVTLTLEARRELKQVVLDTRDLSVFQVVDQSLNSLKFNLGKEHEAFGSSLTIQLKDIPQAGDVFKLLIEYETSPHASAIQWLPAAQTAGKKHPYLFTQCQAIHARSFFPCQDTPSIKAPYTASVSVPEELVALMSAASQDSRPSAETKTRRKVYNFEQKVPMASYLVALAIGKLEKRDISHRCAVWSEAEMVEAGAFEFSESEDFLKTAESICGPYEWGRYDILLLPPSFPYGGMENPCLTFVTPTLLAGDRSLASVVAHEIAHSWMGNLVTSQTWEHFWLNEGWTVFVERKMIGALFGKQHAHLSSIIGWKSLRESVSKYGPSHPYTVLNVQLQDVDPDDAFSSVPYEKGFNLLFHLEQVVGGESVMAPFVKAYVLNFRNSTVTTESFKDFFLSYFSSRVKPEVLETIDWDNRFHAPGLPPTPTFDTTLSQAATELATELVKKNGEVAVDVDLKSWKSTQLVVFLEKLMDLQGDDKNEGKSSGAKGDYESDDTKAHWAKLLTKINDSIFPFAQSKNAEVRFRWLTMCIRADMESYYADASAFLLSQGRMKYTRPLYSDLAKAKGGREVAVETFTKNRNIYHAICAKMVAKDLGLA